MALIERIVIDLDRPSEIPEVIRCPVCPFGSEKAVFSKTSKTEFRKGELELDIFGPSWECKHGHHTICDQPHWLQQYDRKLVMALFVAGLNLDLFKEITGREFKNQRDV